MCGTVKRTSEGKEGESSGHHLPRSAQPSARKPWEHCAFTRPIPAAHANCAVQDPRRHAPSPEGSSGAPAPANHFAAWARPGSSASGGSSLLTAPCWVLVPWLWSFRCRCRPRRHPLRRHGGRVHHSRQQCSRRPGRSEARQAAVRLRSARVVLQSLEAHVDSSFARFFKIHGLNFAAALPCVHLWVVPHDLWVQA